MAELSRTAFEDLNTIEPVGGSHGIYRLPNGVLLGRWGSISYPYEYPDSVRTFGESLTQIGELMRGNESGGLKSPQDVDDVRHASGEISGFSESKKVRSIISDALDAAVEQAAIERRANAALLNELVESVDVELWAISCDLWWKRRNRYADREKYFVSRLAGFAIANVDPRATIEVVVDINDVNRLLPVSSYVMGVSIAVL